MCIHSEAELRNVLRFYNPLYTSAVILRGSDGRFMGAWHCDPSDAYSIANTLNNLKSWHPLVRPIVDLSLVNEARAQLRLDQFSSKALPRPNRAPLPPMDNDRETVARWVCDAQRKATAQLRRQRRLESPVT